MVVEKSTEIEEVISRSSNCEALPLLSLNHVSLLVKSVLTSVRFYEDVLGFALVKRPLSLNFNGAWLYSYGIGIHLLEKQSAGDDNDAVSKSRPINPKDNHISFQCVDVGLVKKRLEEMGMKYVTAVVEDEDGTKVDQVFFHDPDGYMIEICNCENIPIVPLSPRSSSLVKPKYGSSFKKMPTSICGLMEIAMMESLSMEMMKHFSY